MSFADTTAPPRRRRYAETDASSPAAEARSWAAAQPAAPPSTTPTRTITLPNGQRMRLSTDRVRAAPAVSPQVAFMLGQNAIGLGLWGLFAPKGVNRFLGLTNSPQATQLAFGAREMATGMALFSDPTNAGALWARVAGDAFDIAMLRTLDRPDNAKRGNARLALAVVLAVTALDVVAAVRMTNVKRTCG